MNFKRKKIKRTIIRDRTKFFLAKKHHDIAIIQFNVREDNDSSNVNTEMQNT